MQHRHWQGTLNYYTGRQYPCQQFLLNHYVYLAIQIVSVVNVDSDKCEVMSVNFGTYRLGKETCLERGCVMGRGKMWSVR